MDSAMRVRAARGAVNMSLEKFAKAINVGRNTVIKMEKGERLPKPHEVEAMAIGVKRYDQHLSRYETAGQIRPMDSAMRVRAARGAVNMSLEKFAKAINVGRNTVIKMEKGERLPKPHEVEAMAILTGLPASFFTDELEGDARPSLADLERRMRDLEQSLDARVAAAVEAALGARPIADALPPTPTAEPDAARSGQAASLPRTGDPR